MQFECSKWCISEGNINVHALLFTERPFSDPHFSCFLPLGLLPPASPLPFSTLKFQSSCFSPCQPTCTFILLIFYNFWIYLFMSPAFISISSFIFCQLHSLFSCSLHLDLGSILFWPKVCPGLSYLCICLVFWTSTYSSALMMGPAVSSVVPVHVCKTAWHPCKDKHLQKVLYMYTVCTENFPIQSFNM